MIQSLIAWLDRPWESELPFDSNFFIAPAPWQNSNAPTRLEVLVGLMDKNGGSARVPGLGAHCGTCLYGSSELTQTEALALIHLEGVIDGWSIATDHAEDDELTKRIRAEVARVEELNKTRGSASQQQPAEG